MNDANTEKIIAEIRGTGWFLGYKISFWGFIWMIQTNHQWDKVSEFFAACFWVPVIIVMTGLGFLFPHSSLFIH
jgi:hypothetical protein